MNSLWPSWLKQILGPAPNLKELNLICWGLFVGCLFVPLCVVALRQTSMPNEDFADFYGLGHILNEHPAQELYNYDLQMKVCNQVHPLKMTGCGPAPYPPVVGVFFRPFARLSYLAAYADWVAMTLALYIFGLAVVSAHFFPENPLLRSLVFCFALTYYPFVIETMVNGQLSAIAFCSLAVALREDDLNHRFLSGLALSVCLYKPTLLLLLVPMLVVTRRGKTLLGFATGAAVGVLFVTAIEGWGIWPAYLHGQLSFGRIALGIHTRSFLYLKKFVDLTSLSLNMHGGRSWPALAVFFGCTCWAGVSLIRTWWKSPTAGKPFQRLVWAATLTWSLVLNLYVPIYDTILVVLAVILTGAVLKDLADTSLLRWFTLSWFSILACSWITEPISAATGFQILTLMFAALGTLQLVVLLGCHSARFDLRSFEDGPTAPELLESSAL